MSWHRHAGLDEKGVSLVEILLALLLSTIIFTALIQASLVATEMNVRNLLRDEAVSIAEKSINEARNTAFAALVTGGTVTVTRDFRGIASFPFGTNMTVTDVGSNNKQVTVRVQWSWKAKSYTHSVTTVVRKQ